MRFPKAQAGVSKLLTAEILMLIGVVCALIALVAPFLSVIYSILLIIAFIMMMVGLGQAQQDDGNFKLAFYLAIAGIVFSVVSAALSFSSPIVGRIFTLLSGLAGLCVILFAIRGIQSVATKLNDTMLAAKAKRLLMIIVIINLVGIILNFVSGLITPSAAALTAIGVIAVIALILQIVAYILYISLLSKAKKSFQQ